MQAGLLKHFGHHQTDSNFWHFVKTKKFLKKRKIAGRSKPNCGFLNEKTIIIIFRIHLERIKN